MKALAVSTKERMPQLPNVPTVAETVPGYEYVAWNGYAVTGRRSGRGGKKRLAEAAQADRKDPEVVKIFTNLGINSVGTTPEEALASIRKDMPIYAKIVDRPAYGASRSSQVASCATRRATMRQEVE